MKKFLIVFFVFCLFYAESSKAEYWEDTKLYGNYNQTFTLNKFKGKTLLIMFWATWCPYCKGELPALSLLKNTYSSHPNFEILPISVDKDGLKVVNNYFKTAGIKNLPAILDAEGNLFKNMGFSAIPTLVLLSRDGKILGTYRGLDNFSVEYLDEVLNEDGKN